MIVRGKAALSRDTFTALKTSIDFRGSLNFTSPAARSEVLYRAKPSWERECPCKTTWLWMHPRMYRYRRHFPCPLNGSITTRHQLCDLTDSSSSIKMSWQFCLLHAYVGLFFFVLLDSWPLTVLVPRIFSCGVWVGFFIFSLFSEPQVELGIGPISIMWRQQQHFCSRE